MITIPEKTLAYRNNNPGNLRFAGQRGAAQGEGGFAKFETPEAGWNAMVGQVSLDSDRGHTVESFINKYAPPVENDTNNYIAFVEKNAGVSRTSKLAEVDHLTLAKAMAKLESGTTFSDPEPEMADPVTLQEQAEPLPEPVVEETGEPVTLTLENLDTLLEQGLISEDEASEFLTREELKGNFLDMTPDGVNDALDRGLLTEDQAEAWLDYTETPVWFYTKDITKAPLRGLKEAVENTTDAFNEIFFSFLPLGKAKLPEFVGETYSLPGDVVSVLTQFAIPYAGASKMVTAAALVPKVMSSAKMLQVAAAYPKMVPVLETLIHGTVAGAMADYTAFDPFDKRLVDVAEQAGWLPQYLDFMLTDPTDPAPLARLKGVLEGAVTGVALDVLLAGLKGCKGWAVKKYMGDHNKMIEDALKNNDKLRQIYKQDRDMPVAVPKPAGEVPVKPGEVPPADTTGLAALGGNLGGGMVDSMYNQMLESLKKGTTVMGGIDDPFLKAVKPMFDRGEIKTAGDLRVLAKKYMEAKDAYLAKKYTIPEGMKGMKPSYGYGKKQFQLNFESEFDKAAYTLAQKNKSKSHDALMADMMKRTGLTEAQIVAHGNRVRDNLKEMAKGAEAGKLRVPANPTLVRPEVKPEAPKPVEPGKPGEPTTAPEVKPEAPKPVEPGKPGEPTTAPEVKPEEPAAGPRTLDTKKVPEEAVDLDEAAPEIRIFEATMDGVDPAISEKVCDKVEAIAGKPGGDLWKHIYKETGNLRDAASGGPLKKRGNYESRVPDARVELGAQKILKDTVAEAAELYGRSPNATLTALVNMAKDTFEDMYAVTQRVRAMSRFVVAYTEDITRKALEAKTFVEKLKVMEHIKQSEELQAMFYGVRSESGRLQRSFRRTGSGWDMGDILDEVKPDVDGATPKPKPDDAVKPKPDDPNRFTPENIPKEVLDEMEKTTGKDIDKIIDEFVKAKGAKKKLKIARNMGNTRFLRSVLEYVQLNLLYSPATQGFNIVSQAFATVWKTAHRVIGGGVHALAAGDARALQEIGGWFRGMGEGFSNAFRWRLRKGPVKISLAEHIEKNPEVGTFYKAMWTSKGQIDPLQTKFDGGDNTYMEAAFKALPGMLQPLGKIIRWPFHGLSAVDEAFKQVSFHAELLTTVEREARNRFLTGKDADDFIRRNMAKPPGFVYEEAMRVAREGTFQDVLDKFSGGVDKLFNSGNVGLMVKIAAVPFYKIQMNVLKWAARNSAFAPLSRRWQQEFAMGGVRRYEAISRMVIGTGVMMWAWDQYEKGNITGRCPKELRPLWEQAKRQEYSFKNSKGEWVSYERMEPLRTLIGVAANAFMLKDYYDLYENSEVEGEELFWAALASFTDIITSNTWVASVQDLVNLMSGDTRMDPEKLALKQSEKFVPGSMGLNYAQSFRDDPIIRELRTLEDLQYKKLDSHKQTPKRHALYGTEMLKDPKVWGMFQKMAPSQDPVAVEMGNIKCVIPSLRDHFEKSEIPLKLTNDQYQELQDIIAGLPVQQMLESVVTNQDYLEIKSPDHRSKILTKLVKDIRDHAKEMLLGTNEELQQQYIQKFQELTEDLMGYYADTDPSGALYKYRKLMR